MNTFDSLLTQCQAEVNRLAQENHGRVCFYAYRTRKYIIYVQTLHEAISRQSQDTESITIGVCFEPTGKNFHWFSIKK